MTWLENRFDETAAVDTYAIINIWTPKILILEMRFFLSQKHSCDGCGNQVGHGAGEHGANA